MNHQVKVKPLSPFFQMFKKATPGSAGYDAYAAISDQIIVPTGATILIPLGFAVQLPPGMEMQVRGRSGLALKNSVCVLNSPGTVDEDYRQEVGVILHNAGTSPFTINPGDRVCQLVFQKLPAVQLVQVEELSDTSRAGGFGSTGVSNG